jgi:hypothetical protein
MDRSTLIDPQNLKLRFETVMKTVRCMCETVTGSVFVRNLVTKSRLSYLLFTMACHVEATLERRQ